MNEVENRIEVHQDRILRLLTPQEQAYSCGSGRGAAW